MFFIRGPLQSKLPRGSALSQHMLLSCHALFISSTHENPERA